MNMYIKYIRADARDKFTASTDKKLIINWFVSRVSKMKKIKIFAYLIIFTYVYMLFYI